MATEVYNRILEVNRKKLASGRELLDLLDDATTSKEMRDSGETARKVAEKMGKVEDICKGLKRDIVEKRMKIEAEIRSEFVAAVNQDRDPDIDVLKEEMECVNQQIRQTEKNCRKLTRERERLDHDRKYHRVLKGIAPITFDKTSSDSQIKGYITRSTGELHVFEHDLEKENACTVADFLWDSL